MVEFTFFNKEEACQYIEHYPCDDVNITLEMLRLLANFNPMLLKYFVRSNAPSFPHVIQRLLIGFIDSLEKSIIDVGAIHEGDVDSSLTLAYSIFC